VPVVRWSKSKYVSQDFDRDPGGEVAHSYHTGQVPCMDDGIALPALLHILVEIGPSSAFPRTLKQEIEVCLHGYPVCVAEAATRRLGTECQL